MLSRNIGKTEQPLVFFEGDEDAVSMFACAKGHFDYPTTLTNIIECGWCMHPLPGDIVSVMTKKVWIAYPRCARYVGVEDNVDRITTRTCKDFNQPKVFSWFCDLETILKSTSKKFIVKIANHKIYL